jgi:glycosyltransferase involved in cell wall biosynthesis
VLTVGNMYPPLHEGGYELVWEAAVSHLRGHGHEVRVLTTGHRAAEERPPEPGVHRELRWYWRDHEFPRLGPIERLRIERHNAAALDRHLRELDPEVVGWWAMGGMSLGLIERARRRGYPAAAAVCEDWMLYGPAVDAWMRMFSGRRRLGRIVERLTGLPTAVDLGALGPCLFPSDATRERARARWGLDRAVVCHQGVSREVFPSAPERPWGWRLLYAGRIDPRKGIDLAVSALAELPASATLTVAGRGDDRHRAELEELARSLGVAERVTFTSCPRERLAALYATADAIVFPVRWQEPWGLVPLEAMSVGRPVVATGLGGSGEYLRDRENCTIFDPAGGPSALADRVREFERDEGLRARLRAGGFATAARFGEHDFSRAFEELLDRAVAEGATARAAGAAGRRR